jgi:hypothetical protein
MSHRKPLKTAAVFLTGLYCTLSVAGSFLVRGGLPKTAPANEQLVVPFAQEIGSWNVEVRKNGDKPPNDAAARTRKLSSLASQAKDEIEAFRRRLAASGESKEFDAWVEAEFQKFGDPELVAALKQAGGATAALTRLAPWIDTEVSRRSEAAQERSTTWFRMLGVDDAHAALYAGSKLELCMMVSTTFYAKVTCLNWAAGITV